MFKKEETPVQHVQTAPPPVPHECNHEIIETRYLTIEQLRETMILFASAYALKSAIDVAAKVAILAAETSIR